MLHNYSFYATMIMVIVNNTDTGCWLPGAWRQEVSDDYTVGCNSQVGLGAMDSFS